MRPNVSYIALSLRLQVNQQRGRQCSPLASSDQLFGTGGENGDELIFDPATGELRSACDADDPDRVPATQMAREGFFLHEGNAVTAQPQPVGEAGSPPPAPRAEGEELVFDRETGEL